MLASKLLGIPIEAIKEGKFIDNEVINRTEEESHRKVDLLFTTDNLLINIEGNNYTQGILYRNNTYIYRIIIDDKLVLNNLEDKYYYQININTKPFPCNKEVINRFEMRDIVSGERLPFTPIIIHVQLDYLDNKNYTKDIDEWLLKALKLIKADSIEKCKSIVGDDKILGGVFRFMSNYSKDGRVLGEYDAEKEAEFIRAFDLKYARDKGHEEGKKEGIIKAATNMKKENYSIKDIMEITGLSQEEIENIKL